MIHYNRDTFQEIIIAYKRLILIKVLTKKTTKSIIIDYNRL